jgi:hypothetical protein
MAEDKTQEASDVNDGNSRKHIVRRSGSEEAATSSLQISILLALSFITAIKLLSMTVSFGAPPHSGVHLSDRLRSFRDSA